jgi:hypothetical protein
MKLRYTQTYFFIVSEDMLVFLLFIKKKKKPYRPINQDKYYMI